MFFLIIISLPHAFFASRNTHTQQKNRNWWRVCDTSPISFVCDPPGELGYMFCMCLDRHKQMVGLFLVATLRSPSSCLLALLSAFDLPSKTPPLPTHTTPLEFRARQKNICFKAPEKTNKRNKHHISYATRSPTRRGPLDLARTRKNARWKNPVGQNSPPHGFSLFILHITLYIYMYNL